MKLALVAALVFTTSALAQQSIPSNGKASAFTDPANLRGERVSPHTGRELPIDQGARGLEQMLRRLNTRASMMLIVAHPDDEDGGLLTLYSRGLGARVATLTLTRGEGGQNAVTGDFEDALGLIRTQELLSADRYLGADQFFGTEVDFGFSKTKEEAFAKWTHERVLYDAVRAVRLYRPLVIAAVFIGGVTDGHGQHQVSGEIAQEVFKAAGDPKVFPELTAEGILSWAPLKVYARVPMQAITAQGLFDYATGQYAPARFTNYVTGEVTTTAPAVNLTVHEGQTDALLSGSDEPARSYVQFARLGLGLQKTQIGPGVRLAAPGAYDIGYHRYGSRLQGAQQKTLENSFFDGVDTSIEGIATLSTAPPALLTDGLHAFSIAIAEAARNLDPLHPETLAPKLAAAQQLLSELIYKLDDTKLDDTKLDDTKLDDTKLDDTKPDNTKLDDARFPGKADVMHELRCKQVQLNEAIADALGLKLSAAADLEQANIVAGTPVTVQTRLQISSNQTVGAFAESLENAAGTKAERLLAVDTEPSFSLAKPLVEDLHAESSFTGQVTRPYFSRKNIEQPVYRLRDQTLRNAPATPPALTAWATLRYHQVEIRLGAVVETDRQPVSFVPPASVIFPLHAQPLPGEQSSIVVNLQVNPPGTRIEAPLPSGWTVTPDVEDKRSSPGVKQLRLTPPVENRTAFDLHAIAVVPPAGEVHEGYRGVGYPGIPFTNFFAPAVDHLVPVELKLPARRRIGYLPGTGDAVPQVLASIDLPVTMLTVADLMPTRLAQFDTVILGVRTYNAHPELHGAPTQALLDFARNGGNVVVQYQTGDFTGADAPYPLSLGSTEKVVDETALVKLAADGNPVLAMPNRIGPGDFDGWIEERGHGFLQSWDSHYVAVTETHDPGQLPQRGGLITTQFGRGHWTYCAFALYRQLPEAVPGAFRLFTNLLGLADAP